MANIPQKLLKNSIFTQKIRVNPTLTHHILIDKVGNLFEIGEKGVTNVILLENLKTNTIEFQLFYSYKKSERKVFYLVLAASHLYVILREKSLKVIKTYENVSNVQVIDTNNTGNAHVEITLSDEMSSIVTDFSESDNESQEDTELEQSFTKILKTVQNSARETHKKFMEATESYSELYQKVCEKVKFMPKYLRSSNPLENTVLIPYANHWIRIHNQKLVLGLPILNVTYQR